MNHIEIRTQAAVLKTINRAGKATLHFNEQTAALHKGDDFPKPFKITLAEGAQPYAPGRYVLDLASNDVGDFDALIVGRNVKLITLAEYAKQLNAFLAQPQK